MLINGNAYNIPLADESVQCVATSPPYFSLRDYGLEPLVWGGERDCVHLWGEEGRIVGKVSHGQGGSTLTGGHESWGNRDGGTTGQFCQLCGSWRGSLGLEPTPELFARHLVEVFREVRRVLKPDGTVWLNLGDSYSNEGKNGGRSYGKNYTSAAGGYQTVRNNRPKTGLPAKNLYGIPWRVAFALQANGWWLRSEITWCKTAPMPESMKDRPTSATEKVFLLTKNSRYFYDSEAVRVPHKSQSIRRWHHGGEDTNNTKFNKSKPETKVGNLRNASNPLSATGRNLWNYWILGPEPYPKSHFATFPTKLVEPMILAGTSAKGECPVCGLAFVRVIEKKFVPQPDVSEERGIRGASGNKLQPNDGWDGLPRGSNHVTTTGWTSQCDHDAEPVPQLVLDPFAGTATVGRVCIEHGRRFVGLELNPDYIELARERTSNVAVRLF